MSERREIEGRNQDQRFQNSPTRHLMLRYLRDNQRTRAYRCEWRVGASVGGFLSYDEVVEIVRLIEDTPWFQGSTPEPEWGPQTKNARLIERAAREWHVTVGDGRRRRTAVAVPSLWEIRIPQSLRRLEMIIHELAHLIDQVWESEPHGPDWVDIYLRGLSAIGLQERAYRLAEAFRDGGVRGARTPGYYLELETEIDLTRFDDPDSRRRDDEAFGRPGSDPGIELAAAEAIDEVRRSLTELQIG